jgi:hypothetical protein
LADNGDELNKVAAVLHKQIYVAYLLFIFKNVCPFLYVEYLLGPLACKQWLVCHQWYTYHSVRNNALAHGLQQ